MGFHLVLQNDMVALILPGNLLCLINSTFSVWFDLDSSTFFHIVVCNDEKFVLLAKASFSSALLSPFKFG